MAKTIEWKLPLDHFNPKQELFMLAKTRHVAYGGARGGGKSFIARVKAVLLCTSYKGLKVLLLRRTFPELRDNHITPLRVMLPIEVARWKEEEKTFVFMNGSRLRLGYCDTDADITQYQGQEYDVIIFEEATHFTEYMISMILLCNRSTRTDFRPRAYYTCNPGGPGHAYIKRLFVDKVYKGKEKPQDYTFIQAKLQDNDVLMKSNGEEYIQTFANLPETLRKAQLEGDWDVFEGQVFTEWNRDIHIVKKRLPQAGYNCYRSLDWGFSKPFSIGWWYIDYDGNTVRYREYYGCTGDPDKGLRMDPYSVGLKIAEMEQEEKGQIQYGVADTSCWYNDDGGIPVINLINKALMERECVPFGMKADKAKGSRISGKMQLHYRFQNSLDKKANGIYICENCRDFIRTIPALIYDRVNVEDVDTTQEDHIYDETRYFLGSRTITPETPQSEKHYNFDFERKQDEGDNYSKALGDNFEESFFEYGG
jgi:phage terminase large subunit